MSAELSYCLHQLSFGNLDDKKNYFNYFLAILIYPIKEFYDLKEKIKEYLRVMFIFIKHFIRALSVFDLRGKHFFYHPNH